MNLKSVVLSQFNLPILPTLSLLIFFGIFVGALFWVYRKGSSEFYSEIEKLPLKEP